MALIHEKIPAIIGEVKAVGKDHLNEAQKYKFRAIDDVYNALNSVLAKHKVSIIPRYSIIHNEVVSEVKKNQYGEKTQNTRTVILQGTYKSQQKTVHLKKLRLLARQLTLGIKRLTKQ